MVSSIGARKGARTEEEDIIPGKCVEKYDEGSRYQAGGTLRFLWFFIFGQARAFTKRTKWENKIVMKKKYRR